MKPQYVEFVTTTNTTLFYQPKWYEKLQVWLIRLLGGTHPRDTITFVRIPIDGETFAERLFKQKEEFFKQFRPEPTRMLIGSQDYQEIMDSQEFNQYFRFESEFHNNHTIYGLTVEVIPWMRGMVIMP